MRRGLYGEVWSLANLREHPTDEVRRIRLPVEDNYREQQAEELIAMSKLCEKLDGVCEEREGLQARLAMLADGERAA